MEIRKYMQGDGKELRSLQIDTIKSINSKDHSSAEINFWISPENMDLDHYLKNLERNLTYVALIDGVIAGFGDLNENGEIKRLYTHKEYQKRGIASAILNRLEEEAKSRGFEEITLESTISAKLFYESKGFVFLNKKVEMVNDVEQVAFNMKKKLGKHH